MLRAAFIGHVDILFNNAGGGSGPGAHVGGIFERGNDAVEHLIKVNLMGSFWCKWCDGVCVLHAVRDVCALHAIL